MRISLLSFFTMITLSLFGQADPNTVYAEIIDFDNWYDTTLVLLEIDSTDSNNIWQIDKPQKTLFNQAYSFENVIITDIINTYPTNDTSIFTVRYFSYNCPSIFGNYYVDTDSLSDYGMIEISIDSGQTWLNILGDSMVNQFDEPILTGNSNGWQSFNLYLGDYAVGFGDYSFLLKFTFISDSIDTQQEGIMFDDLAFCIAANTKNLFANNALNVFPNPATDLLNFQLEESIQNAQIRIYSTLGQLMETQNINSEQTQFNVSDWQNGMYFYGIFVEGEMVKSGQVLIDN